VPLKSRLEHLRSRLKSTLEEAGTRALVSVAPPAPLAKGGAEPPVVARLMVEIRSDGTQTIARGALEDMASGEKVAVEARGATPAQLAGQLARTLFATPFLARAAVRAVLDGNKAPKKPDDDVDD
jgi:hypothetical protein